MTLGCRELPKAVALNMRLEVSQGRSKASGTWCDEREHTQSWLVKAGGWWQTWVSGQSVEEGAAWVVGSRRAKFEAHRISHWLCDTGQLILPL